MRKKTTTSLRGSVELANHACKELSEKIVSSGSVPSDIIKFFDSNIAQPLARAQDKIDRISASKRESILKSRKASPKA